MPSLGQIMGGVIGGVAGGIANAIKNNSNKGSSGSSGHSAWKGPSGGSSGGSSGGLSGSGQGGKYSNVDLGNTFWAMVNKGVTDADYLQSIADARLEKAQGTDSLHKYVNDYRQEGMQAYIDHLRDGEQQQNAAWEDYQNYMQQAADQQQAAIQAGVDSAVADLESQKNSVGKLTKANNAAAEKAYMQTINPNGSLAENLAANGLLSSGLTETSQIQAGNSYQGALNNNALTETEAIAEIERAINQARLNGDLTAAQALSDMLTQIAEKGYEHVQNIAQLDQWNRQFGYNMGVTDAGLTGMYNGNPTLEAQRLQLEKQDREDQRKLIAQQLEQGQIDIETGRKQLQMLDQEIAYYDIQLKQLGA